jgi:hypothetical protein
VPERFQWDVYGFVSQLPTSQGRVRNEIDVVLHRNAFDFLVGRVTPGMISRVVDDLLDRLQKDVSRFRNRTYEMVNVQAGGSSGHMTWRERIDTRVPRLNRYLGFLFSPTVTMEGRWNAFLQLMVNDPLFMKIGPGVITRLADIACGYDSVCLGDVLSVRLRRIGDGIYPAERYFIGVDGRSPLVNTLMQSRDRILDREFNKTLLQEE